MPEILQTPLITLDDLQLITGIDIAVPQLKLTLRQPRLRDIAILGEHNYFLALSIFKMTTKDLKNPNPNLKITNWTIFIENLQQEIHGIENVRFLLTNFLQLFFLDKIVIGPRSLLVNAADGGVISIEESQFDCLQDLIVQVGGGFLLKLQEGETFKPKNKRAAEIAEKMKKARKKLADVQNKTNEAQGNKEKQSILAKYIRGVSVKTANSLEQVNGMTLLQLNDLMKVYLNYEAYDLEIKSRLAGAKGDEKLEHWLAKSLTGEDESKNIGTI